MPRKKKEIAPLPETKKRWAIVDSDMWDITPLDWGLLPEEIIDYIPDEFVYDLPVMISEGRLEVRSYVYLHGISEDKEMDELSEMYGNLKILSSDNYSYDLVVPSFGSYY